MSKVITGLLINTVRCYLIPVSRRMKGMTNPLPIEDSVANRIDQEGCFVTLKAESRDLQLCSKEEVCVNAQPRLVKRNLVLQVVQANPPAPLLLNSQVMLGNHNNSSLAIIGLGRIRQEQLCQLRRIKCVHCRGVKPRDNPTTLSITRH
jgi:hypothetical protein